MAFGDPLIPSTTTYPNTNVYPGQGLRPDMICRVSFDDARVSSPTWYDFTSKLLSFEINRGAENELDLQDTATAAVAFDGRNRDLDPSNTASPYSPKVLPRRRLWLQSQWDGETIDQFYGWTGGWKQSWENDWFQVASTTATDGLKVLAGDALPTTDPPRDSYADVVLFDQPFAYWRLNEPVGSFAAVDSGDGGHAIYKFDAPPTFQVAGLIVGERDTAATFADSGPPRQAGRIVPDDVYSSGGTVSLEAWWKPADTGAGGLILGPADAVPASTYSLRQIAGGVLRCGIRVGGTTVNADSTTVVTPASTYHVVGTYDGANVRIYINGTLEATSAQTGQFAGLETNGSYIAWDAAAVPDGTLDEVAIYPYALSAARVTAHYQAGAQRGRAQELGNDRIAAMLEQSGLAFVPRRLRAAEFQVQPIYYTGQSPKGEVEAATFSEGDPAMFFFAKDGAAVFLDRAHRSVSPWNTVQATFDDDGTDTPYISMTTDDGESFIYNDVRRTAKGGTLQQTTDPTSIGQYQRSVRDQGETLNVSDADASTVAGTFLATYKDPQPRITSLDLSGEDSNLRLQMLRREIGDSVRVIRRPSGGGTAIDQTSYIRKTTLRGDRESNPFWSSSWAISKR
jgi:hypothetical protein